MRPAPVICVSGTANTATMSRQIGLSNLCRCPRQPAKGTHGPPRQIFGLSARKIISTVLHQYGAESRKKPSLLVPRKRLELSRPCGHRYLKPARLPIPPPGQQALRHGSGEAGGAGCSGRGRGGQLESRADGGGFNPHAVGAHLQEQCDRGGFAGVRRKWLGPHADHAIAQPPVE